MSLRNPGVLILLPWLLVACRHPLPSSKSAVSWERLTDHSGGGFGDVDAGAHVPVDLSDEGRREIAANLLWILFKVGTLNEGLEASPIEGATNRIAWTKLLREHIARMAILLDRARGGPEGKLQNIRVGVDLAGLSYDLLRVDVEATRRGMAGVVRNGCNRGLDLAKEGILALERDSSWATREPRRAAYIVEWTTRHRDNLLTVAPWVSVMKAGVSAASSTSLAVSLARLVRAGMGTLMRVTNWMRGLGVEVATLELAGVPGRFAGLRLVSANGALVLTDTEVIAVAQTGQLSATALSLYMMAKGAPGKLPDEGAFSKWIHRTESKSARIGSAKENYQVKHAGPREFLVKGGGEKIWADGVRASDSHLLEVKYVTDAERSPFIEGSKCWEEVRYEVYKDVADEFRRYAAIIRDRDTPAVALEVITNEARAVPFFEALLRRFAIPGRVVVKH